MKLPKRSTDNIVSTIKACDYDDYMCTYSFVRKPVNSAYIEKLATEMVLWAQTDEALKISQFWLMKGICNRDFKRWCDKHECLRDAYETVKALVGNRREMGALRKQYDSSMVRVSMKLYDEEWKGIDNEQESSKQTIVVVEKMPTSYLVPEKKGK